MSFRLWMKDHAKMGNAYMHDDNIDWLFIRWVDKEEAKAAKKYIGENFREVAGSEPLAINNPYYKDFIDKSGLEDNDVSTYWFYYYKYKLEKYIERLNK